MPHSEHLDVDVPGGTADAYLARPATGTHPGVLLCMDAFGLRRRLFEMADRIAAHGYVVLAPNLFHRFGRAPIVPMPDPMTVEARAAAIDRIMPMVTSMTPEVAMPDAAVYLDALEAMPQVSGPLGLTGYCMGGTFALRVAGTFPDRVAAVATFHGGHLATEAEDSPHRRAADITAELLLAHADQDRTMPPEAIERLEAALDAAGVRYHSEVYPGAPHGFTMTDTPNHQAAGEQRHWEQLLELFCRVLQAG